MSALERLLSLAERLTPSGVIGDGTVAEFHSLAAQLRAKDDGKHPPVGQRFEARGKWVRRVPVETKHPDGTTSSTMGFRVLDVSAWCAEPEKVAVWIAVALNNHEATNEGKME